MNNLGGNTDNIHLGDTKVLGDLEVRDDLIIDGEITITPPDCLNVDCIKPSTLNGDVSIKNSNEDTIIKLSNDESVEISGSYKLPTTAGTEGQLLTADAGGLTTSFQDQALPLTPSQEIGYIAIANTSYNTSRTLIWSSLGGTNQFSTDVLGTGGYVEFKSIGKIYTRRTQDGIISDTYRLEVDVVQTGGYVNTSTFTWSISDNVFVLNKDVDYERDYEFRFTIQKMNDNSFTIFGSGTATQLVNPTGTIQLPVQKIQFQDVKDSDSNLLFTDVGTDVKLNVYFTAVQDPGVIASFVPFSGQFHAHQLGFLPEVVLNTSDHSALSNLSLGDSHTQYSLSNGRFGGQTLTGGTSITDKLVLQSNSSNPLDGHVELKSFIDMTNNQIINVSTAGGIGQLVDTNTTNNTGSVAVHSDVSSAGSGIIISSGERTAISTNTTDITGKLTKSGDAMTGILKLPNGSESAPSLSFTTAPTSGLSVSDSDVVISAGSVEAFRVGTTFCESAIELRVNGTNIKNVANPINPQDAATKHYVDNSGGDYVLKAGDTMGGELKMDNNDITDVKKLTTGEIESKFKLRVGVGNVSGNIQFEATQNGQNNIFCNNNQTVSLGIKVLGGQTLMIFDTTFGSENIKMNKNLIMQNNTIYGGIDGSNNLILESTTSGTKGSIVCNDSLDMASNDIKNVAVIDGTNNTIFRLGTQFASLIKIGQPSVNTEINSSLRLGVNGTAGGTADTTGTGTLRLGPNQCSKVEIADIGITTEIRGPLNMKSNTIYGGPDASDNLTLESTPNASKGFIILSDDLVGQGALFRGDLNMDYTLPKIGLFNNVSNKGAEIKNNATELLISADNEENEIKISHTPSEGVSFTIENVDDTFHIRTEDIHSKLNVVTDRAFRQYRAVNPGQNGFPVLSGMYSMINSSVLGGTTTEASCFNDTGSVGTRINPANTLNVGDTYHLHMSGHVQSDGKGHGMTFRLKLGTTTLMTTNSDDWDAGGTPTFWELEVDFVIRTIGGSGTMMGGGMIQFSEDSWWKDAGSFSTTTDLSVDTTISNTFDVTAQWDNNNANNILTTQVATIQRRF